MFKQLRAFWTQRRLWLTPGLGIKRWLAALVVATVLVGIGAHYFLVMLRRAGYLPDWLYDLLTFQFLPPWWRVVIPLAAGALLAVVTVVGLAGRLVAPFRRPDEDVVQSLYRHSLGQRGPRVVAIGGGTGMPTLLRGLKQYTSNITAIVTVADDGGSSGRLRRELGLLPPGDFRNNIAALARDETLMAQVMQYRFGASLDNGKSSALEGHAFGNLLLAALTGITGSFDEALLAMDRVLAMRGRVVPSTLDEVVLTAQVEIDGQVRHVAGESQIPKAGGRVRRAMLEPEGARAYPPALQAIFRADLIVMGPGSLYTSVLPNLLVNGLAEALRHSRAPKVYVCNIATQPGETDGYGVAEHVEAILQHVSADCIDIVLANDNLALPVNPETTLVQPTAPARVRMLTADLVDDERPWRHDSAKLAQAVMDVLDKRGET